jgi:hypothetical protein
MSDSYSNFIVIILLLLLVVVWLLFYGALGCVESGTWKYFNLWMLIILQSVCHMVLDFK